MAVTLPEGEYYFNAPAALKESLRGATPDEVFNHPNFPKPLPVISQADLKTTRLLRSSDVKKAMVRVLQTAASADIAHDFMKKARIPFQKQGEYALDTPVTPALATSHFLPQFTDLVGPALGDAFDGYRRGIIPSPILDQTHAWFGDLIEPALGITRTETAWKLQENGIGAITLFVPNYSHGLRNLFERTTGQAPTVEELTTLIENSTSILGIIAVRNMHFLIASAVVMEDSNKPESERYDTGDFKLLLPPSHRLSARLTRDTRSRMEAEYGKKLTELSRSDFFLTAGCPAASDLIDLTILKYAQNVRANATGQYATIRDITPAPEITAH